MTLLLGAEHRGKVHLLADSITVDGDGAINVTDTPKVWRSGPWVVGVAGSWRVLSLLRWRLELPDVAVGDDIPRAVNVELLDAMQAVLREAGYSVDDEKNEVSWECLIGIGGSLFYVDATLGPIHPRDGIASCGHKIVASSGAAALRSQRPWKRGAEHALRRAAEAAEESGSDARGPFTYVST